MGGDSSLTGIPVPLFTMQTRADWGSVRCCDTVVTLLWHCYGTVASGSPLPDAASRRPGGPTAVFQVAHPSAERDPSVLGRDDVSSRQCHTRACGQPYTWNRRRRHRCGQCRRRVGWLGRDRWAFPFHSALLVAPRCDVRIMLAREPVLHRVPNILNTVARRGLTSAQPPIQPRGV